MYRIYFNILILILYSNLQLHAEGFLAGMLIRTPAGYTTIENLIIGNHVVSIEHNATYTAYPIHYIAQYYVDRYMQIYVQDTCIAVAPDQLFYLPREDLWVTAADLTTKHIIGNADANFPITYIEIIEKPTTVYALSIAQSHTYCVSPYNIQVHNIFPAVVLGLSWAFGLGSIEFTGASVGLAALGAFFGIKACKNKKKTDIVPTIQSAANCNGPKRPKKKNNDDEFDDHPHGTYEDAEYHHKNSNGHKSRAPKNGQQALDNSIEVGGESHSRVAVQDGEIVILNRTANGLYHGHVRTWGELEQGGKLGQRIINTLIKQGLASRSGKILI
ncbi:MAG TPA: polymorphic toxin-type HINT domain-containing protein [Candidatus Babeliales bacterium]|jgi:hypothetical protein|nr:polymorphic toxin-type HINT domain-containing protein [Candidatus Babeliales bacterium]